MKKRTIVNFMLFIIIISISIIGCKNISKDIDDHDKNKTNDLLDNNQTTNNISINGNGSIQDISTIGNQVLLLNYDISTTETNTEITNTDEMFIQLDGEFDYLPIEDINTNLIAEVAGNITLEQFTQPLVKVIDNGFLVATTIQGTDYDIDNPSSMPILYKLDSNGEVVWEKTYPYEVESGSITNLITYEDGRILFSVSFWPMVSMGSPGFMNTFLVQCDKDGNEIWKRDYVDYIGSLMKYIFLDGQEAIITVGEWYQIDQQQDINADSSDIVVTKLDDQGIIINQQSYGGDYSEFCNGAFYDEAIGLVITGWTNSAVSDMASDGTANTPVNTPTDYIICINENLDINWTVNPDENERYNYDQLKVKNNSIYFIGYCLDKDGTFNNDEVDTDEPVMFWGKLDENGDEIFKQYETDPLLRWSNISVLNQGQVIVSGGNFNSGKIIVYNQSGVVMDVLDNLSYMPEEIIPTKDNGFIVKSIRTVAFIPQPAYVSSIWMDQEVVLIKYNSNLELMWRKTYDAYKNSLIVDFVMPY